MQEYRAFILGADGRVKGSVDLLCENEGEAIKAAKQRRAVATGSQDWAVQSSWITKKSARSGERLNPQFQHEKITFDRPA
jgi:hypothetical protein